MTQPSLNSTFDASLVDLRETNPADNTGDSFSTASSTVPSDGGNQLPNLAQAEYRPGAAPASSTLGVTNARGMPVHYVPTVTAYDAWSSVYDGDGNILQAVDDIELATLLPAFLSLAFQDSQETPIRIVDFGCGTGRNTVKLLSQGIGSRQLHVRGYDASKGMLDVARQKLALRLEEARAHGGSTDQLSFDLVQHDFLDPVDPFAAPVLPPGFDTTTEAVSAVISTLVLEHLPLRPYFAVIRTLLKPNGLALVTNMHRDMGLVSQAGFERVDENGVTVKVRGCSWAHGVQETVEAAREEGLEVVDVDEGGVKLSVRERTVENDMIEKGLVSERGRKWIGKHVWYGVVLRRVR
ncbi:S-adenosyl-L-methionine-dependent methyltransferase [Rhizodiscina lignyota]|uniref:S-adenosyl-L-methionine-dependent methyltransferase n=1 Tax=Rhizodiscina lignyota TaxID=1504668 RepID=A0A9P4IMT6_9PEZI|nr:S-adenosyl-L-methionine-dependent methyltransferase [Rhizodiscina lignyota]